MYQTIQVSTCVSAQGELVESLPNGEAIVRDGDNTYRGRAIPPLAQLGTVERLRELALRAEQG